MFERFKNIPRKRKQAWLWNTLIGIGVFVLILIALANIDATPYNTFTSQKYRMQIKYPAYWTMVKNPPGGAVAVFVSPKQNPMDLFQESINVVVQPLPGQATDLTKFSELTVKQLTGTFKKYVEVLEGRNVKLGGRPAYRFVYKTGGNDPDGREYLHVWAVRGPYAYIITYAARAGDFDEYKLELRKVLRSFEFL